MPSQRACKRAKAEVEEEAAAAKAEVDEAGREPEAPDAYPEYDVVLVESVQGRAIKIMFDVLRDIVPEIAVTFGQAAMTIDCIHKRNCVAASVRLDGESFEQYRVAAATLVGLHPLAVLKLLKGVSAQDTVAFGVSSLRPTQMDVIVKNGSRNMETTCSVTSLDLPDEQLVLPATVHPFQASMKSVLLKDLCRDLQQIGEIVTVTGSSERTLEFAAERQGIVQRIVMGESELMVVAVAPPPPEEPGAPPNTVSSAFISRMLGALTKAYTTSHSVVISVGEQMAIKLQYKVGDLGDMMLVLSPCERGE